MSNDDFSNFLNFADIPLNMASPYDEHSPGPEGNGNGNGHEAMDTELDLHASASAEMAGMGGGMVTAGGMMGNGYEMPQSMGHRQNHHQNHHQNQHQHHNHNHHFGGGNTAVSHAGMIPLTPTSLEMHGDNSQAGYHHMDPHMMTQFTSFNDDPVSFLAKES